MKYYCEVCDRDVDDQGPYEKTDGDYFCQGCMEEGVMRGEALYDQSKEEGS